MRIDAVTTEILWNKLIGIADEMGAGLARTAFSSMVREGNDFACVIMDHEGNSISQCTRSIPSFATLVPQAAKTFMTKFPRNQLFPGDILITNDPWHGSSHLPDLTMIKPIFCRGRLQAFAGTIAHLPDIGGNQWSGESREIFQEGLRIPICKLFSRGTVNDTILEFVQNNVRLPEQVIGDIRSQVVANELGEKRVMELLDKGLDLKVLAKTIHSQSEKKMRAAVSEIPEGIYDYEMLGDGYDELIEVRASVAIRDGEVHVDYTGSSPQSPYGISSVYDYTYAYTAYALKCVLDPITPNNQGCYAPFKVSAPRGSIMAAEFPAAVGGRYFAGHLCLPVVFGALSKVIPERVQADGAIPPWLLHFVGFGRKRNRFILAWPFGGGHGASSLRDGISCISFPTNTSNIPVEVAEVTAPVLVREKNLLSNSAGLGEHRGGLGQRVVIQSIADEAMRVSIFADRIRTPPRGLCGGQNGRAGAVYLDGSQVSIPKRSLDFLPNSVVELQLPGGGGYGPVDKRLRLSIEDDVKNGLMTERSLTETGKAKKTD